ncbi:MAG: hypothetical protein QOK36_1188, partial [Gaiellales bacterium]|nr:hypothetical protein [Gaiellales bacterium]
AASAVLLSRSQRGVALPWRGVPRVVLAAAAALGAGLAAPVPVVVQAIIATAVYGVALALVGRFPPELQHVLAVRRRGRPAG